ncbi:MAG: hypothetical protein JNL84_14950 [Candidatus Accumulibacter sp.]|nr:hypothetical protein [Accumulibacter sp.]
MTEITPCTAFRGASLPTPETPTGLQHRTTNTLTSRYDEIKMRTAACQRVAHCFNEILYKPIRKQKQFGEFPANFSLPCDQLQISSQPIVLKK